MTLQDINSENQVKMAFFPSDVILRYISYDAFLSCVCYEKLSFFLSSFPSSSFFFLQSMNLLMYLHFPLNYSCGLNCIPSRRHMEILTFSIGECDLEIRPL